MSNVHTTLSLVIKVDSLPPEIPGTISPDGDTEPISGAEQVAYDIFKRIQEILPDNVYGFIENVSVTD